MQKTIKITNLGIIPLVKLYPKMGPYLGIESIARTVAWEAVHSTVEDEVVLVVTLAHV